MSLYDRNRYLAERIALVEGGGRRPIPKDWVDYDPEKGHYWRTISGRPVMFDKGGRMLNAPKWMGGSEPDSDAGDKDSGLWKGPISKKQHQELEKSQSSVDEILGGDPEKHGVKVELDDKGNPVLTNAEVKKGLEKAGEKPSFAISKLSARDTWDVFSSLVGMADMYSGMLLKAAGPLASVLKSATDNLLSALEDWQR